MSGFVRVGLAGVIAVATFSFAPAAMAQPVQTLSVEGGAACTGGTRFNIGAESLGKGECGWTGAARFDQYRSPLWMAFDAWGIGARHMDVDEERNASRLSERRTTIDLDASMPMGMGLLGLGPTRFLAGIRYADYDWSAQSATTTFESSYWGIGPRIGTSGTIVLGRGFQIDTLSSISVLFGNNDVSRRIGAATASQSSSDPIFTYESSMALSYLFAGEFGPKLSAGWRSEYWFRQIDIKADANFTETRATRNVAGPFLRFSMPLR